MRRNCSALWQLFIRPFLIDACTNESNSHRDKRHADVLEVLASFHTSYLMRKCRRLVDDREMYVGER